MEYIIIIILAISSATLGYLLLRKNKEMNALRLHAGTLGETVRSMKEMRTIEEANMRAMMQQERANRDEHIAELKRRILEERANFEKEKSDMDRSWGTKFDSLKNEMLRIMQQQISESGDNLRESNRASLSTLLQPLKEEFEVFRKSVEDTRTQGEVNKKELQEKFDSTLRLFIQQQESAVRQLCQETAKVGNDAVSLAKALKTNTKQQGNWGEMVLSSILENSGLEENVHYFTQYNVKDSEGRDWRPDVVIKFPEGRNLIIDSKVSLTAFTESFETEDETRREQLMRAHLDSVYRHVDELSRKDYPRLVPDSLDHALMFIPNESSYIAAMRMDPELLHKATRKKVIIVSPNNLIMALQLAYNMWQNDKQVKSVQKIVERGRLLYEKMAGFQSSFDEIGKRLKSLQEVYDNAGRQALYGKGNILSQCETLREMGVRVDTKKRLRGMDETE